MSITKALYSHKLIMKGDVVASCGQLSPTQVKSKQHSLFVETVGGLVGYKVPMLLAVYHQGEGFFVWLCCCGRSRPTELEEQTINNKSSS